MVALRSPYLLSNARLREAAAGGKPLGEGERSPAVAQMQAALLDLGYGPGGTAPGQVMDGAFGAHTAELVKAFQRDRGLASTGVLDMGTLLAADTALAATLPAPIPYKGRPGRSATVPPPHPAPRRAPPIGLATPYPLPYWNDDFEVGTAHPLIVPDVGAGAWNSKPATFSAKATVAGVKAALINGKGLEIGFEAVRHLRHYFWNSGTDYQVNLEGLLREVQSARKLFRTIFKILQEFVSDFTPATYNFTFRHLFQGGVRQSENLNWFLAVGSYSVWVEGKVKIGAGTIRHYDMELTYRFFDRYNWDTGKSVDFGLFTVNDAMMGEFHRMGLAREYNIWGSIRRRFSWAGTQEASEMVLHQFGA